MIRYKTRSERVRVIYNSPVRTLLQNHYPSSHSPNPFENVHCDTAIWCFRNETSFAPVYPRT